MYEIKYQVSKMAKMLGIYPSVLLIYLIITGKYFDVRRFNKHLERIFSDKSLKAIQIGSNDGISNDPLRKYIVQNDWDAVLIEAVPIIFKRLSNLYKDNDKVITLNVAISPSAS